MPIQYEYGFMFHTIDPGQIGDITSERVPGAGFRMIVGPAANEELG